MFKTFSPPYPDKFHLGDIAISKGDIYFCDGTKHIKGQRIVVKEETKAYYNVCHTEYDKESKCSV